MKIRSWQFLFFGFITAFLGLGFLAELYFGNCFIFKWYKSCKGDDEYWKFIAFFVGLVGISGLCFWKAFRRNDLGDYKLTVCEKSIIFTMITVLFVGLPLSYGGHSLMNYVKKYYGADYPFIFIFILSLLPNFVFLYYGLFMYGKKDRLYENKKLEGDRE